MRLQLLFLLLLVTSQLTLGQDEVESSGWSSSSNDDATAVGGAENQERDLSTTEGEQEEEVDPYPELNWPRAGGAIFDPAGGMYLDATEVLVYSLITRRTGQNRQTNPRRLKQKSSSRVWGITPSKRVSVHRNDGTV
jgi:hypothetical protein